MTKYIAHPSPEIKKLIPFISTQLNTVAKIHPENNQVCIVETNLENEEIESRIQGYDLIVLVEDEISDWL